MRAQVVSRWQGNEKLPEQFPGFKRISFQLLGTAEADIGMRALLNSLQERKWRIPERAIDLAAVAFSVYAADMGIPRALAQDSWTREIALSIPVSAPNVWEEQQATLTQLLNYLTGDRWFLAFRHRAALPEYNVELETDDAAPSPDEITLFSGGLDSCVGAIDALSKRRRLLCVSHAGDGLTSNVQHEVLAGLTSAHPKQIDHLRVWFAPKPLVKGSGTEKTTRGRSFLFFAAATVAAATQSTRGSMVDVLIPENGFISLNVPLDPLRLGAHSTRTTHPFVLALWNQLLAGLKLGVAVKNPYQFRTKGEMFSACRTPDLLQTLLPITMSCSSPTKARWQKLPPQHCGHCVPCIIRRAAVTHAFGADPTPYTVSMKKAVDPSRSAGRNVRAFQRALAVNNSPRVASIVVHSSGPLPRDPQFAALYLRGLAEVGALVGDVVTKPKKKPAVTKKKTS